MLVLRSLGLVPWVYVAKYLASFIVVHGGESTLVPITLLQLKVVVLFVFLKNVFDQILRCTHLYKVKDHSRIFCAVKALQFPAHLLPFSSALTTPSLIPSR